MSTSQIIAQDPISSIFNHELSDSQRLLFVYGFVFLGLVLGLQFSQILEPKPARWTRLTKDTRLNWYSLYVLEALLLFSSLYAIILRKMVEIGYGNEERILNMVWIGLLGLEVAIVFGIIMQAILKSLAPLPKEKTS